MKVQLPLDSWKDTAEQVGLEVHKSRQYWKVAAYWSPFCLRVMTPFIAEYPQ